MLINFFKLDWHTPTHLFGSFFLVHLFMFFGMGVVISVVFAFVLGALWEVLDEVFKGELIFDPRGGDMTDIIINALGCILAIWV